MKDILDTLEITSDRISNIADQCLELAKKGDKWACIHCGYVIIVGDNKPEFAKKIKIHTDLCISKLYQDVLKGMRKEDKIQ